MRAGTRRGKKCKCLVLQSRAGYQREWALCIVYVNILHQASISSQVFFLQKTVCCILMGLSYYLKNHHLFRMLFILIYVFHGVLHIFEAIYTFFPKGNLWQLDDSFCKQSDTGLDQCFPCVETMFFVDLKKIPFAYSKSKQISP